LMLTRGQLVAFTGSPGAFPAAEPVNAVMPRVAWYHYAKVSKPDALALAESRCRIDCCPAFG
jgi:hypothetical protein